MSAAGRLWRRLALLAAALLAGPGLACADGAADMQPDRLVISISQPQVRITSTFTGAELVVFGVAQRYSLAESSAETAPDVVVTVRGPRQNFVTWRKSRVFGMWVNSDSRTFVDVPAFLSVQSSRPPDEMAPAMVLRAGQIGLGHNTFTQRIGVDYADVVATDPFRAAFLRTQKSANFYQEDTRGVTFLSPGVFRANIEIPGQAPIGTYDVTVQLLRDGHVTATATEHLEISRSGFEQEVATFSQNDGILYGITVALGSLVVGFIGNFLFRKE